MPLTQSCMHWRAFLGKLYKEERRGDGLAQAVGSGPGPGTPATCKYFFLCLFVFFALYSFATTSVQMMVLQCRFCVYLLCHFLGLGGGLSEHLFASVNGNVSVCTCGPKLSFTNELCRSLNFCSKLSLSVPGRKKEKKKKISKLKILGDPVIFKAPNISMDQRSC